MKNAFFTKRMKMADVIAANHNLILVMPRLGIPLGFGERSVQEVCDQYAMPVDFVLLVFNVYTFDDFNPDDEALNPASLEHLVPYLMASHKYYVNERLPHIERHLTRVAQHAGERYGQILKNFFADYEKEVLEHFASEENDVFPYLHRLLEGHRLDSQVSEHFADHHTDLVDKLTDLTQIVYKYLPGETMTEELNELVFGIMQLSSDLQKHAKLEEKVLIPYIEQLERSLQ
jgi:regulator of cell morphogenesis and NO signaling